MEEFILERISCKVDLAEDLIKPEHSLQIELGFDSLDLVDIIYEIEKEYNICIPDWEIENVITVNDLFNLNRKYINNRV